MIWAMFQPHTYSRTRTLLDEFAQAFDQADQVIVLPIYAARETNTMGVSSGDVVSAMRHPDARCAGSLEEAVVWLGTEVRPGDVVLTLGAGDGDKVGEWLLEILHGEQAQMVAAGSQVAMRLRVGTKEHGNNGTGKH